MRNGLAKCLVESGLVVRSANKADVVAIGGLLSHTHPANTFSRQTVKTALTAMLKAKHFLKSQTLAFQKCRYIIPKKKVSADIVEQLQLQRNSWSVVVFISSCSSTDTSG